MVGREARRGDAASVALAAGVAALLAAMVWSRRWMADDGYINLRVVDQLLHGHGPVLNAGERVEPTTSALWPFVLAVGDVLLPLRLEWIAVALGLAFTVTGLAAVLAASSLVARSTGERGVLLPVGALVVVALPPVWDFGTSGLEGGLIALWLGAAFLAMVLHVRRSDPGAPPSWWLAALAGLGPLVRPDFLLFSLAFVAVLVATSARGHRVRTVLWALAPADRLRDLPRRLLRRPGPEHGVRQGGRAQSLAPGVAVPRGPGRHLLAPPSPGGAARRRGAALEPARPRPRSPAPLRAQRPRGGAMLDALYVVRVGGRHMHGRLLLPSVAALVAPVAVVPGRRGVLVALVVVPWATATMVHLRPPLNGDTVDVRAETVLRTGSAHPVRLGFHLRGAGTNLRFQGPDGTFLPVLSFLGAKAYAAGTDVYVLDQLGLGDWFTGRMERTQPGSTDHEKPLPFPWVLARARAVGAEVPPEVLVRTSVTLAQVSAATAALDCGKARELADAVRRPLTIGRFVANLGVARRLHGFRFRSDPLAARRQLC